jgi:2-polyprenyl-3-methyl-5-hydroxy-6-metoxy-1,4-benzoquinol methylase
MRKSNFSALDPFGQALLAYWRGNKSTLLIHEFKSGRKLSLPVSVFFRSVKDFFPTENALVYCQGRILVVGAGTGIHALELERQGHEVTSIEVCPQAVLIMKERGVKDIRQCNFFEFEGELYDTILMLGHNIGICETVDGIKKLLQKCKSLLSPGGQLLVNSVDESVSLEAANHLGYSGELEFRLCHEGNVGPWMRWLHVDFDTLSSKALEYGWSTEKLIGTEEGGFLARLNPS